MHHFKKLSLIALGVCSCGLSSAQVHHLSQVNLSSANAISDDGRVIVGDTTSRATTVVGGLRKELLQVNSFATAVSPNGQFIGGWSSIGTDVRAFVSGPNGLQDVPRPIGLTGINEAWQTEAISDNGSTYILTNDSGGAFRFGTYAVGAFVDRLPLAGGAASGVVKDMTPSGSRAAGWLNIPQVGLTEKRTEPCYWDGLGAPIMLRYDDGNLLTFFDRGRAQGISADGTRIVGWVDGLSGKRACYWNVSNPNQVVLLPQAGASAFAVSGNGSVIVGSYLGGQNGRAALWINGEFYDLKEYLGQADYMSGYLGPAKDVSADGKVIIGASYSGGQWVATLDAAPVAVADSYQATATAGQVDVAAPGVLLNDKYLGGEFLTKNGSTTDSAIAVKVTEAQFGTVELNVNGSFVYTPSSVSFYGHDSFTYRVIRTGIPNDVMSEPITVTIDRSKPTTLTSTASSIRSYESTTATVQLSQATPSGGTYVTLGASSIFEVPSQVFVPGGQTSATFPVRGKIVDQAFSRPVWATHNGVTATTYVTVEPDSFKLYSLTFDKTEIASQLGGAIGKVQMTAKAAADTTITLSSSSSALVLPSSVTIQAGSDSRTFNVSGNLAATTVIATVTAQDASGATKSGTIRIVASPLNLTFPNNQVIGGLTTTGVVTLMHPAGPGGVNVTITEATSIFWLRLLDQGASSMVLNIPEGETSASFTLYTDIVSAETTRMVTATMNGLVDGTVFPPVYGNYSKVAGVTVKPLL